MKFSNNLKIQNQHTCITVAWMRKAFRHDSGLYGIWRYWIRLLEADRISLWENNGSSFCRFGKNMAIVVRPDKILLFKGNHLSLWGKKGSVSFRIALSGFISSGCASQDFFTQLNGTSKMLLAACKHWKPVPEVKNHAISGNQGALEPAYLASRSGWNH